MSIDHIKFYMECVVKMEQIKFYGVYSECGAN